MIKCPFCQKEKCDCDWGLDGLFREGNIAVSSSMACGAPSGSLIPTDLELELSSYDSIYDSLGTGGDNTHNRHYKSVIIDRSVYKIGDLVTWHPFWGMCDWGKPWIIKRVMPSDPLDCSFYDYEITDGMESHFVTYAEINKLEGK